MLISRKRRCAHCILVSIVLAIDKYIIDIKGKKREKEQNGKLLPIMAVFFL